MRRKFHAALAAYGILALVGVLTVDEPRLRAAVLVLLAALAVKTWIGELQHRQAERERLDSEQE